MTGQVVMLGVILVGCTAPAPVSGEASGGLDAGAAPSDAGWADQGSSGAPEVGVAGDGDAVAGDAAAGDAAGGGAEVTGGLAGWHTQGRQIRDPSGRAVILHGINLSNDVKRPPFESWANEPDYARLQGWGYNTVRLLTGWAAIMPEEGVIDEAYLAVYDQRVQWATAHGLLVIVDMHQDVFGLGFGGNGAPRWACDEALYAAHVPRTPWYANYGSPQVNACYDRFFTDEGLQEHYLEAAKAVLKRYAGDPSVVGIDLMNEPHFGTAALDFFHRERLQPFYERLMTGLSEVAPETLFFVEPVALVTAVGAQPAFEAFPAQFSGRVVYAPHYYHFSVHDEGAWNGTPATIASAMGGMELTAAALDVPWILGEHGGHVDAVDFDIYEGLILDQLDGWHAGDTIWVYDRGDGGFAMLKANGDEEAAAVGVHARVYPKRTAGDLGDYHWDWQQRRFEMSFESRDGVPGPTVIALPAARHFPEGFVVECSDAEGQWGWTFDAAKAELTVETDPTVTAHTLVVRAASGE